jgi:chemotaxis protein methyltransferase CheR
VRSLADRGAWDEALAGCRELLAVERLNPFLHLYHGLILEQTGRHAEAEEALRRALYLDRRCALAHYYLGLLLQKGHRPEGAARSFRNALTLLSGLAPGHSFTEGDGITAAELANLARMNLEILEGS